MFNEKKGQVTVFIILGVIFVIIVGLVLYVYGDKLRLKPKYNFESNQIEPLKNLVDDCIKKEGGDAIKSLSEHGGRISPKSGYWYMGKKISYLCYTEETKPCENKVPFLKKEMEMQINSYLPDKLKKCINLDAIRKDGYDVQEGGMNVSTEINDNNVMINVGYPIVINKGSSRVAQDRFSIDFKSSLGRFADVAADIVDSEVQYGKFFNDLYEITHHDVVVKKWKIGNSGVYTIKVRGEPVEFRFAVKGWAY